MFLAALVSIVAAATPAPGEWRLESQSTHVKVLSWGLFCGKEPRDSRGLPGAKFTLTRSGDDFEIKGAGRHFGSSNCGMDPTGFKPRVRDHSGDVFSVTCDGPEIAGQPQSSEHRFEIGADGSITYVTKGEKRKKEAMDQCRYAYTTTMKFNLATEAGPCAAPGRATKLVLSPASKDAEPGERICFTVAATDSNGCVVNAANPVVTVEPVGALDVDGSGCVWAPKEIKETVIAAITIVAEESKGNAVIRLLKTGGEKETIEQTAAKSKNETVKRLYSEVMAGDLVVKAPNEIDDSAKVEATVVVAAAEAKLFPWFLLVGGAGLLFVMVAFAMWLRSRKVRVAVPVSVPSAPPPAPGQGWKCPICKFEYASSGKCVHDGAELVRNEVQGRATMFIPEIGGMVCPTCGTRYPKKARFCGNDRTPLVPDLGQVPPSGGGSS